MGTKNKPGAHDCYSAAEDDEPMFILLGRDPQASCLIRAWVLVREMKGEDPAKVAEARRCADEMDAFYRKRHNIHPQALRCDNCGEFKGPFAKGVGGDGQDLIICKDCCVPEEWPYDEKSPGFVGKIKPEN